MYIWSMNMLGDILLEIIKYLKSMIYDTKIIVRENTCIHDYKITHFDSVCTIKRCNKCGREKYIKK